MRLCVGLVTLATAVGHPVVTSLIVQRLRKNGNLSLSSYLEPTHQRYAVNIYDQFTVERSHRRLPTVLVKRYIQHMNCIFPDGTSLSHKLPLGSLCDEPREVSSVQNCGSTVP